MNKQTKKVFSIIVLFSLLFSILSTYADVTGAKTKISNMQHSSTPSGDFGYILSNIFDSAQKLKPDFYDKLTESQVEGFVGNDVGANHVPKGNGTKLLNSSIYDNGNVGIGTTNPGSYKLNVNGTLNATTLYENGVAIGSKYLGKNAKAVDSDKLDGHDSSYFQRDITGSCPAGQSVKSVNADGSLVCANGGADNLGNHTATQNIKLNNHYLSNDGGNEGIRIDNSGNVGIGTTSPSQKLTVAGNIAINNNNTQLQEGAGNALRMRTNHGYVDIGPMNGSYTHLSTDRPKFYFNKGIVVDEGKVSSYNEDLSLQTGGNTKVTIKNGNGNVGIGTTSPSEKLSVAGRVSLTTDPNSGDDVGDRDYNDARYINVGESGDSIQDNTIDSSEIQDNSLTASDLAANSVGNSELIDNPTVSTIYASNWFRSTGASGWYNNTYGGGWYMADSSWIRSYGNKNIYINKMLRADDGFQVDGVQVIGADAWVEGDRIRQGTIDSSEIQDNSLTASDLAANSVGTSEIADNTVSSTDILNNTITEADISDSFKARDADKLDGENSSRYTKSGNYYSYDFNNLTDSSRVTSISSTAHSPFGNARYTVYNARHRGGEGDGYKRGSQIAIGMTNYTNRMAFRNQSNGTWQGWNEVQNRVTGSCPAGQSIRAIASNGTVTCEVDTNTNLSQSTVETYIANDVSTNYVPRDNGTKLVTGTIYDNGTNIGIGTSNPSQKLTLNGNIGRTSHSNGYFVGSYNNVGSNDRKTNPIYTIGNNYKPSDTSLGNMYGIGYSHSNFWGTSSNKPSGWGQYVAADGDIRVILEASSGRVRAASDVRAPRFYDTNNTSYYVDPASTSYVNDLRANIIYDRQNTGYYLDPNGTSKTNVFRANIFYDNNNTGYYVNPDGSSNLNSLRTQGNMTVDRDLYVGENGAGTSDQYFYDDNSNTWRGIRWNDSANYFELEDNNGNYHRITTEDIDTVGSGGDNLGNHTATTNLNMNSHEIDNPTQIDMKAGNGYGLRFWSSNNYKISMGNSSEYKYGPVTDYSIKNNMSNTSGRGFTWGVAGQTPTAGLEAKTGNFQVKGSITAGSFLYYSDRRLKKNIKPLDSSLEKINKLEGVSFNWKKDGTKDIGVIAQDVEKVYPDLVNTDKNTGLKSVKYGNLVSPIIEAIKELTGKFEDLFNKYLDQQKQIDSLEQRLERLEKLVN